MRILPYTALRHLGVRMGLLSLSVQLAVLFLYVIVDWFERSEYFWKNSVTAATIAAYYVAKSPLIISQTVPLAISTGVVLTLVIANRAGELLALRSGGLSSLAIFAPLYAVIAALCLLLLVWGEYVVPPTASKAQQINLAEIKRRARKNVLADVEVWMRGRWGFYHIGAVDRRRQMLIDLTIYKMDPEFRLHGIVWFPVVEWTGAGWREEPGRPQGSFLSDSGLSADELLAGLEPFSEFIEFHREPEELGFFELRAVIRRLQARGLSAGHYLPELHAKLAVPFAPLVLVVFLSPLAASTRFRRRTAAVVLVAIVAGFVYWFVLSLGQAAGGTEPLSAAASAWLPNIAFLATGLVLGIRLQ